jgi:aminoglycoside phosphotransferase (APT) family kinase protein
MTTPICARAEADADLRALLDSLGAAIVESLPLSSTVEPRAFRLTTNTGRRLKLRVLRTPRHAEVEAYLLDAFAGDGFPRLCGRAGRWLLCSWVEGVPAADTSCTEDLVRRSAALQSRVHALRPPPASWSSWRTPEERLRRVAAHLDRLSRERRLSASAAADAGQLARQYVPVSGATGLGHGDLCAENIVVAADGAPVAVDNETCAVMPLDHDLARTWYRWRMAPGHWQSYLDQYAGFRDPAPFLAHFPYWAVAVLAASAVLRSERAGWSPRQPLARLHALLRSAREQGAPERLALA